jgi:hypothetical protein
VESYGSRKARTAAFASLFYTRWLGKASSFRKDPACIA